ncbi:MAG: endonuclease/exonuclease/phosphatase family protein [Candidatus Symbiothrix sp.]|jgi:endonuclease/exonuclease/phosphatase family metal-dependent hydrolase|nr:endonuclease/exonuclease/phosphatase family protein [Candidatus Symbiothrix sp.]
MKCLNLFIFSLIFGLSATFAQNVANESKSKKMLMPYALAFYNLENLFDTINSNGTYDLEYSPQGVKKWNTDKYSRKINNMAYALSKLGKEICPAGPTIIGVSEIENRKVLEDLVKTGDLAKQNLQIVHYDSPDLRGVDVALLYNPAFFQVQSSRSFRLEVQGEPNFKTRDPLLVSGLMDGERFHIIVNHWPSRSRGELQSRPLRVAAAQLNKSIADSLRKVEPDSKIIIMGDLNDDPTDVSLLKELDAKPKRQQASENDLFNPMAEIFAKGVGTLGYNGKWNLFDQIIISGNLLGSDRTTFKFWKAEVFNPDFLIAKEGQYKGHPLRTHSGNVFLNGYSDHFPVLVYFVKYAE